MNVVKKNTICPAGDVIVKLVETKHVAFRRAGVDLHTEVTITLREALLGFERSLGAQTFWYGFLWKNAGQMRISPWRNWEFHLEKLGLNLKRMVSLPCKTHILARQDKKKRHHETLTKTVGLTIKLGKLGNFMGVPWILGHGSMLICSWWRSMYGMDWTENRVLGLS